MDFALSPEQTALATNERNWLAKNDPIAIRRPEIDSEPARVDPRALAHVTESGFVGLLMDDIGGSYVDLLVLVEEHGRAASSVPVAELALATKLLAGTGTFRSVAEQAAEGEAFVTPVIGSPEGPALTAGTTSRGLHISGTAAPGPGRSDATGYVALADLCDGRRVAAHVPAETAGVSIRTMDTLDLTRDWTAVHLDVELDEGQWCVVDHDVADELRDAMALFRAVDALGAADRLLEGTVEYALSRTQFGQSIGSFQAIKHHCANMAVAIESSRAAAWAAAVALDGSDSATRRRAVSAAAAHVGTHASETAQLALQVHGGIGFTWEHDLHLLLRRIKVDEALDGSVAYHRRRLITTRPGTDTTTEEQ
ncbi:acyl-CoA dehydrogenase family protein [Gordonia sp. KTR9]|uniref:acyl-CoA dehydrogenase family protein n=1 Tax=Gordonia sp. KTR9 TaxID=337191 RepID=UPI00027DE9F4|nr:acyl-CoA dehydrogenase family protein [Gordonia sp. KTR9]AFR49431.1 Acyl-CoA dehydrogenase [Gordonia sp. KTR9]